MFRPELRFDHPWDREGYSNGNARSQLLVGSAFKALDGQNVLVE
jgi:hypothetical protein